MTKSVIEQVKELETMPLGKLRDMYKNLFGKKAPDYANCDFLKQHIAYRIQEVCIGSMSPRVVTIINNINKGKMPKRVETQNKTGFTPGTHITKEWKGSIYRVLITTTGFTFNGQPYKSLSAIAKIITGTHWSGNRFFGIKEV